MLVLSRKIGETIVIDNNIQITILDVRGDNVKVGVAAPRHISVHREEIFQEILKSNQQAKQVQTGLEAMTSLAKALPKAGKKASTAKGSVELKPSAGSSSSTPPTPPTV
ncbi:MAG: carbon storage regulator CsrA [Vampirovibrionales bacterium]